MQGLVELPRHHSFQNPSGRPQQPCEVRHASVQQETAVRGLLRQLQHVECSKSQSMPQSHHAAIPSPRR